MNKLILWAALIGAVCALPTHKISNSLKTKDSANIMVTFVGGNVNVVNSVETKTFRTRTDRINTLKVSLQEQAELSQHNVKAFLREKSVNFRSFWISNEISIKGASADLIQALSAFPEVAAVEEEQIILLDEPETKVKPGSRNEASRGWGIDKIQAPDAWRITNGSGVIVANIDGGVRPTHETLRYNHREDYGWYDPYDQTSTPIDFRGHGTHTMGTIAGSGGIGVAPGAEWIACRGCDPSGSCSRDALTACGEWALCPTRPDGTDADCSKAPVLVSNSWGGSQGDTWYEPITEAWIAAGIVPIFAIGNSGPSCASANSPGDMRRVIGVGSTNSDDAISSFSSVGPAPNRRVKPDISAPGEDVESAGHQTDTEYSTKSGTSMACPHVAGVTALLLSVDPTLSFGQVRRALMAGLDTELTSRGASCESLPDTLYPNHHFGFGRINALKVVEAAVKAKKASKA